MSNDVSELKRFIGVLEQAASQAARLQEEMRSNQKKLEGLHAEIAKAEERLEEIKVEGARVMSDASKNSADILSKASLSKAEADTRLVEAKKVERAVQVKMADADDLKGKYQSALEEVNMRKEKLKAALV